MGSLRFLYEIVLRFCFLRFQQKAFTSVGKTLPCCGRQLTRSRTTRHAPQQVVCLSVPGSDMYARGCDQPHRRVTWQGCHYSNDDRILSMMLQKHSLEEGILQAAHHNTRSTCPENLKDHQVLGNSRRCGIMFTFTGMPSLSQPRLL